MADDLDWVSDLTSGKADDPNDQFDDFGYSFGSDPATQIDGDIIPGDDTFAGAYDPVFWEDNEAFGDSETGSASDSVTIQLPDTSTIQVPDTETGAGTETEEQTSQTSAADPEPVIDDSYIVDDNDILKEQKRDTDLGEMGYDETRPLWEVYIDGYYGSSNKKLIHRSGIDDTTRLILNPTLELTINDPGSFSFTILPNHLYYNKIEPMYTDIFVYSEGVELFRGRVTNYTIDINRQKNVTCEGDLGYLSDAVFKLYNGEKKTKKV